MRMRVIALSVTSLIASSRSFRLTVSSFRSLRMMSRQRQDGRPSLDDVERISRGEAARKRGIGSRGVPHRLNAEERKEWELATSRGFIVLRGTGYRKERKGSPLANTFRQFCDAKAMPFVSIETALGVDVTDFVVVDLSPLRRPTIESAYFERMDAVAREHDAVLTADPDSLEGVLESDSEDALTREPIWKLRPIIRTYVATDRKSAKAFGAELFTLFKGMDADALNAARVLGGIEKKMQTKAS